MEDFFSNTFEIFVVWKFIFPQLLGFIFFIFLVNAFSLCYLLKECLWQFGLGFESQSHYVALAELEAMSSTSLTSAGIKGMHLAQEK